jgi:TfoX/Sxy family transcriptional regulator of competence genes
MSRYQVESMTMFGAPCYFVNGNMFAGVISDRVFLRLSPPDLDQVLREGVGREFEPVPGRKMREYCSISGDVLKNDSTMKEWLDRGYSYVSSLEIKKKKPRKR